MLAQTLISSLETADTASGYAAKQAAFNELQPLVWRQILAQAQRYYTFMEEAHEMGVVAMKDVRADELISGWLNLRSHHSLDIQVCPKPLGSS